MQIGMHRLVSVLGSLWVWRESEERTRTGKGGKEGERHELKGNTGLSTSVRLSDIVRRFLIPFPIAQPIVSVSPLPREAEEDRREVLVRAG